MNWPREVAEDQIPRLLEIVRTKWSPYSQLRRLVERDGLRCHWCKRICDPSRRPSADLFPTREHVIRKADGGTSDMHNLVLACRKCNNTRHGPEWKAKGR